MDTPVAGPPAGDAELDALLARAAAFAREVVAPAAPAWERERRIGQIGRAHV